MKKVLAKVWLVGLFLCLGHGTAWATDLRLNPDGIKALSTYGTDNYVGDFYFKDVFSGTPINECTLQDIVDCIGKYTSAPASYSEKDGEISYTDTEKGVDACSGIMRHCAIVVASSRLIIFFFMDFSEMTYNVRLILHHLCRH